MHLQADAAGAADIRRLSCARQPSWVTHMVGATGPLQGGQPRGRQAFTFPQSKHPKRARQKVLDLLWPGPESHQTSLLPYSWSKHRACLGPGERAEVRAFNKQRSKDLQTCFKSSSVSIFIFYLLRATPTAYGGSQARGQVRVTAASLHHSYINAGSKPHP